jgi:cell division transport system permease protein
MAKTKKPTQFYATASTTIVLIMLSLFLLIFFHSNHLTNKVKENLNILLEIEDNLAEDQRTALINMVKSSKGVKATSVKLITKEMAKEEMDLEMSVLDTNFVNPFKDLITFNLTSEQYSELRIKELKEKFELEKGVIGLFHENESIENLKSNLNKISFGILIVALCFILLAIVIIFNTIKLTLYSDLKEIKTMQMVGAENSFIKKPYLRDAFWMSMKSSGIMIVFITTLCFYLVRSVNVFSEIVDVKLVLATIVIAATVSFFLQVFTTNHILRRFLKRDLSQ